MNRQPHLTPVLCSLMEGMYLLLLMAHSYARSVTVLFQNLPFQSPAFLPASKTVVEIARFNHLVTHQMFLAFQTNDTPDSPYSIHISSLLTSIHQLIINSLEQLLKLQATPNLYQMTTLLILITSVPN